MHLVALGRAETPEREAADALYGELADAGLDVLYDDRDAGVGEKLTDAELLGCPLRVALGKRGLESSSAETQVRRGRQAGELALEGAGEGAAQLWRTLP